MLRIGLKRPDQAKIGCSGGCPQPQIVRSARGDSRLYSKKIVEPLRGMHLRQPVLAALLGGLDCNLLPSHLFLRGTFGIDLNNGAIGNDRRNLGCTDLDCFLDDQLHVFAFWNRLPENDPAAQRRSLRFVQFAQSNFVTAKIDNLGCDFASASIEQNSLLANVHTQDVAQVVGFRSA